MLRRNDRYYRHSVLPFAVLMILSSIILVPAFAIFDLPIGYRPFVDNVQVHRALLTGVGVVQLLFGFGLAIKSRFALYGFLAYLGLATTLLTIAYILYPPHGLETWNAALVSLFGVVVNGAVAAWLFSIRSIFK